MNMIVLYCFNNGFFMDLRQLTINAATRAGSCAGDGIDTRKFLQDTLKYHDIWEFPV